MYTQTKTEIQQRIAITEWLEANFSQFKNQKKLLFRVVQCPQ